MRTVAAQLRASGDMPAPAHFGLLTMLKHQPRTLSELAALQGVSLPTMSNSVATLVQRGLVKRSSPPTDRRIVLLEVTALGRSTVERVGKAAEGHLAKMLGDLDTTSSRRLRDGLTVLRQVFAAASRPADRGRTPAARRRTPRSSVSSKP
jgi:DNA-binding MarR family transcriptional regulator